MGALGLLLEHPVTSFFLAILIWTWVKLFVEDWDWRQLCLSYQDAVLRKQYWRMVTAPAGHRSVAHLLVNLMMVWSCRAVEALHGSWFMLRYSIVLMLCEALLSFVLIQYSIRLNRSELLMNMLYNLQSMGCSGVVLAWLAFLSTEPEAPPLFFLGMMPMHAGFMILPTVILYYMLAPVSGVYSNLSGLLCGYLLAAGALQLLPDTYWTLCFFADVAAMASMSVVIEPSGAVGAEGTELLEVVPVAGPPAAGYEDRQLLVPSAPPIPGGWIEWRGGRIEDEEEDAEREPLLGPQAV